MAARRTKMDPEGNGFQIGPNVRVERGLPLDKDGHAIKHGEPVWIVAKKVDVTDDPDTTYSYRYEEAARFPEEELRECPEAAFAKAEALAGEEE